MLNGSKSPVCLTLIEYLLGKCWTFVIVDYLPRSNKYYNILDLLVQTPIWSQKRAWAIVYLHRSGGCYCPEGSDLNPTAQHWLGQRCYSWVSMFPQTVGKSRHYKIIIYKNERKLFSLVFSESVSPSCFWIKYAFSIILSCVVTHYCPIYLP